MTVLEASEIQKIIPHRYPMLLVDRIIELEPMKRAVGIKNITMNEMQFLGHFPGDPVPSDWTSTEFAIDYVRVYEYTGELVPTEQEGQAPNVNLLANPGFDTDLSGWETWTENGSVFSCSEGCLRADIYTTLPNTWSTQFYQNVDVYSGTEYRLPFKVRSSVSLDDISLCRIN